MRSSASVVKVLFALAFAAALSVGSSGTASAVTWGPAAKISDDTLGWPFASLAASGDRTFVAAWRTQDGADRYSRSIDGGQTWNQPTALHPVTPYDTNVSVAADGPNVDVTYYDSRLIYAHSGDHGATFDRRIPLSAKGGFVYRSQVARRGSTVAVVWDRWKMSGGTWLGDSVRARISTNGGVSFGPLITLDLNGSSPTVAIGDGVIYVAWVAWNSVVASVSRDAGVHWAARRTFGVDRGDPAIAAYGSMAVLAMRSKPDSGVTLVRTLDRGMTWRARQTLDLGGETWEYVVGIYGGRWWLVTMVYDATDDSGHLAARTSDDHGATWSSPTTIASTGPQSRYRSINLQAVARGSNTGVVYTTDGDAAGMWIKTGE
jgi:hypothetical protein